MISCEKVDRCTRGLLQGKIEMRPHRSAASCLRNGFSLILLD